MKIKGLNCLCSGEMQTFDLDHYTSGECTKPPMPVAWVNAILGTAQKDRKHSGNQVSATRMLGCPREMAILDNIPLDLDVRSLNTVTWGTAVHAFAEQHSPPGAYAEIEIPPEGEEAPMLFGVPTRGTIDVANPDLTILDDYKCHGAASQKWKAKESVSFTDDEAQLNIYRILIAKAILKEDPEKYRPTMRVWHGAMTAANSTVAPWILTKVRYMDEETIRRHRPKGGLYTVQQIVDALVFFKAQLATLDTDIDGNYIGLESRIQRLPLVGRDQMRGQKCTQYCIARDVCDGLEGINRP